jgi:hypothetical protein
MSSEYPPLPSSDPNPNPTEETQKKRTEFWHRLCDAIREHKETPRDPFEVLKGWNVCANKRAMTNNPKHFDAYYFDEEGNRYRSKPEVFKFLDSGIRGKPPPPEKKKKKELTAPKPNRNNDAARKEEKEENDNDEEQEGTREKESQPSQRNRIKRKTSEAREEWTKLSMASSAMDIARSRDEHQQVQEQNQQGHLPLKKPRIMEQRQMMQEQQQRPKVTRRHDCKNFFNVVSSQEKLDLIRMVTGATVTVDASLPTVLIVEGTEQEVRKGVNKINEMIENTRERNRLISERATKQSMKPLNVMSIISAVKGEDNNSNRQTTSFHSMNSNGTHISPPNGKSMSVSPTTLADAFVPEAVRVGSDELIKKVRTSIRENKMFSLVGSIGRETYRFVKKHGDIGADKVFEGLKALADESVESSTVIAGGVGGGGEDKDNDSEMKLEIERKIVPLAVCSAIVKAAFEDIHSSEGGSSDRLDAATKAKGFIVDNIQKYLRPMLRGIMRDESQLSQDLNRRKRAYDIAKKTQLKCIVFLDEWSNNTECGDLSKHETIQPAKDVLSELRRRAKDRIEGKHGCSSIAVDGSSRPYSSGVHRIIDRVQRPEAKIKIDSDLSIAMKKSTGENGDEDDHHEDLAFSLENQYGGFAGIAATTQLGDFSSLRRDLSAHVEQHEKVSEPAAGPPPPPMPVVAPRDAERDQTPEPQPAAIELAYGDEQERESEWD